MDTLPTSYEVGRMLSAGTGEHLAVCTRFPTGLCHFVFDVVAESGKRFVVRVASAGNEARIDGSVYWSALLRPIGIPLPEMLHRGVVAERHFTVLERFPGTDLGNVLADLTTAERRAIASAVVGLQHRMRALPDGAGYGYVTNYNGPYPKSSWAGFIDLMLARSATRCAEGGIVDPRCITRVRAHTKRLVSYFASIEPRPFLDDLTTKNVIVSENRLVGVVDVDECCFGDRLLHVGLTRMAFLDQGWDEDYIAELCNYQGFGVAERHALDFYTALYCVDFLAELGHAFNREGPPEASAEALERRLRILEGLLSDLAHRDRG